MQICVPPRIDFVLSLLSFSPSASSPSSFSSSSSFFSDENSSLTLPLEDEEFLFKFLRPCNFNPEDAQRKIVKYYSYQLTYPELFTSKLDESIRLVFDLNILWISPVKTSKSQQPVILFNPGNWNPEYLSFDCLLTAFIITVEVLLCQESTQTNGIISIIDTSNVSWSQVKSFGPSHAKKTVSLVEEVIPGKITNIHVINRSQLAKMAVQVIKPFLNPELTARSKLHSDLQSLGMLLGTNVLPSELGGSLAPMNGGEWFSKLIASRGQFAKYWSKYSAFGFTCNSGETIADLPCGSSDESTTGSNVQSSNFIMRQLAAAKKEPLMDNLPKLPSCVTSFFK